MGDLIISKEAMQRYLQERFKKPVEIKSYERLGSGWHGSGYKIVFKIDNKEKEVVLRTIRSEGFSHDYAADRARAFLLQQQMAKDIPKHIKLWDVVSYPGLKTIGDAEEFFQLVEVAHGSEYNEDCERIKKNGLTEDDKKRALVLSDYLVELHKNKFNGNESSAKSIYKRHLRDCVGHGEMLMGVFDTFPEVEWTNKEEFAEIICKAVKLREKLKHNHKRLCRIHGDFHPGNIIFSKDDFQLLDASREVWGEPVDDLAAFTVNYIRCALEQGGFKGPFKELFELFWENYIKKTNDKEIQKFAPLFFAFRGVVVAHPIFYSKQTAETKKKIFSFVKNTLNNGFDYKKVEI